MEYTKTRRILRNCRTLYRAVHMLTHNTLHSVTVTLQTCVCVCVCVCVCLCARARADLKSSGRSSQQRRDTKRQDRNVTKTGKCIALRSTPIRAEYNYTSVSSTTVRAEYNYTSVSSTTVRAEYNYTSVSCTPVRAEYNYTSVSSTTVQLYFKLIKYESYVYVEHNYV
jgi:hypothetical protein